MSCGGCGKLPGLIQCCLCDRKQGAGPLLCMTVWNEAAEPRCVQNTILKAALLQLHTPDSHSHFATWFAAAQGLAPCHLWSSAGEGLGEAQLPETDLPPVRLSPLLRLTLPQSPQALAAVKGSNWIRDSKTPKVLSYRHVEAKNQFFICIFRGSTCFLVSLVFAGITQASL